MTGQPANPIRLSELVASLSLATDLGMGQPMEQALRTCLLSMKAGHATGISGPELHDVYYLALLRFVGCTADAHEAAAAAGGDEIADRARLATVVMGEAREYIAYLLREFARESPPLTRVRLVAAAVGEGKAAAGRQIAAHCEVAQMLAARLGLSESVAMAVGASFEHWDGKGLPGTLSGQAIPVAARVVAVARDVDIYRRIGGWALVRDVLSRRRARAYDPAVADAFLVNGAEWLTEIEGPSAWDAVISAEPEPHVAVPDSRLDDVLQGFAEFIDLKTPFTLGHSTAVGELSARAAMAAGLPEDDVRDVRRAGFVHDLGKAGVPNGILEKFGTLSAAEWERVRLHPYLSERILSFCPGLRPIGQLAGSAHERVDGSGYHRGVSAESLPMTARILAAANAYQALRETRAHRPAMDERDRAAALQKEADQGRLDREAVRCVLAATGQPTGPARESWPRGLTGREVEVLRLISRGASNKDVAGRLVISPKTAGRHIENIYAKIGVSSRASAALFAVQNGLLE